MKSFVRPAVTLIGLAACLFALWLLFPGFASSLLTRWLHQQGYHDVTIAIDRFGWHSLRIPLVRVGRVLKDESVTISVNDTQVEYSLGGLLSGRCDRIVLADVSVDLARSHRSPGEPAVEGDEADSAMSLWNIVTVSDVVQGLPTLPFAELQLKRLVIAREQATGPLRQVVIEGTVRQPVEGLLMELSSHGQGTQAYVLRASNLSTGVLAVQLETKESLPKPIASWRSEAIPVEGYTQLRGSFELHVQALAPFVALAAPIGSEWQQVSGRVQANWEGTAPSDVPLSEVWRDARAQVQGTLRVGVKLPEWKGVGREIAVAASGSFTGNASSIRWAIAPGTLTSAVVDLRKVSALKAVRAYLPPGLQPVRAGNATGIHGGWSWNELLPYVSMDGPLVVSYGDQASPSRVELTVKQVRVRGEVVTAAEGAFLLEGEFPSALRTMAGAKHVTGQVRGTVTLDGDEIRGVLTSASTAAREFEQAGVTADRLTVAAADAVPFRFDVRSQAWSLGSSTLAIGIKDLRVQRYQVDAARTAVQLQSARGSGSSWNAQGTLTVRGLAMHLPQARPPASDWTVRFSCDQAALKAEVQAQLQGYPVIVAGELRHEWDTQRGSVQGTTNPFQFDRATFRLQHLLTPWPYPFDVAEGNVSISFDAAWEAREGSHRPVVRSGSAEVTLDRLAGTFRAIDWSGLSVTIQLRSKGVDRLETVKPVPLTVGSVNTGIPITNLAMTVQGEWELREPLPIVEVRDVRCDVLGGQVASQGVRADLAHPPFAFTLLVRQLDLQQVLGLEQQQGLQGSGLLDGSIPVTMTLKGPVVKDGQLEARPPGGVIRYRASPEAIKAVTEANAHMQLVLQALNNFHYSVLQVGAQYAQDGLLHMKARLEGRNPDMNNSPPVHFNLTVQENIPALLKSLRLVQDIEDSVQRRLVKP